MMKIEAYSPKAGEEKINSVSSVIFLGNVHTFKGISPVIFAYGPQSGIGELFAWGAYSWPTIFPFEQKTIDEILLVLQSAARVKWGLQPKNDLFKYRQPEIIQGIGAKELSSFKFIFDDETVIITDVEDFLVFLEDASGKSFAADGWGSEKKALLFYGTKQLYGEEIKDLLCAAIYGEFTDIAEKMLKSFRVNKAARADGIILTPEAWEQLAKEKFVRESSTGNREASPS